MGTEIADRNNPSRQLKVNADGSIDVTLLNGDIQIGAVEIKDGDSDRRVDVFPCNGHNVMAATAPGHISTDNSTSTLLDADATFTGEWEDITNFGVIVVTAHVIPASATDGLVIEFSMDTTSVDSEDKFTVPNDIGKSWSFQAATQYFRVKYTNSGTNQTHFHLQTSLKPYYVKPSSHRIQDSIVGQDDAELVKAVLTYQSTGPETFKNIGVQVPLPSDGDSLYEKDIHISKSDNGGFSGEVIDYFNNLNSVNNDDSATNPKIIKVWLKRTAYASALGLGCDNLSKSFSNIKLELFGSGEVIRNTIDESGDDTKRNSYLFQFAPTAFNGFFLSFYTADEIGLSNITVPKEIQVVSRLKALKPNGVVTDIDATAGGNLKVSLEEFESVVSSNTKTQLNVTPFHADGTEGNLISGIKYVAGKNGIDAVTEDLVVVTHPHHEVHSGDSFFCNSATTLGINDEIDLVMTTPDTTRWSHILPEVRVSGEASFQIYEDAVIGTAGTPLICFNRNRNSTTAPTMSCQLNPTYGTTGALLMTKHFGSGKNIGGEDRGVAELILKQNSIYIFRVTSETTSNDVTLGIDYYEHTNKN